MMGMVSYRFGAEGMKLALAITRTAILYGPPPYSAISALFETHASNVSRDRTPNNSSFVTV